jgi:DNA-binding CsgD family transcriptional regulator
VDERLNAQALVQQLSPLELEALLGMMKGESLRGFARGLDIRGRKAADLRESMKCKLGVIHNAGAVRIGLISEIADHHSTIRKVGAS